MGGHHSKQSVDATSMVVTNASMNVVQNCMAFMDGDQVISVLGSGNIVKGNIQRSSLSVDSKCVSRLSQQGDFQNRLNSSISQEIQDQEVGLTQWMDPSGDKQSTHITQMVSTSISLSDVQDCLKSLEGSQLLVVRGDSNVVVDNLQEQTMNLASSCLMGGGQTADVVDEVTNTVNQHSTYESENPLAFVTDAIEATFKSTMAIAAVVFIALVVLVLVFEAARGGGGKAEKGPPSADRGSGGD